VQILVPHISCIVHALLESNLSRSDVVHPVDPLEEAIQQGYQTIYIIGADGIQKQHMLTPGKDGMRRYVRSKVPSIPGTAMKTYSNEANFLPAGKIPLKLLQEVKNFFRRVIIHKKSNVEAMIWILWGPDRGYFLEVPDQTVGGASARYDPSKIPEGCRIIVDIHSHANFNAFFSGTDDNDDRNSIRYSGVIGHNASPVQDEKWRFCYLGNFFEVSVSDIFDEAEAPQEWLDKIGKDVPTLGKASTRITKNVDQASERSAYVAQGFLQKSVKDPTRFLLQEKVDTLNQ